MNNSLDISIAGLLTIILIIGAYQIYFLPQKHPIKKHRSLILALDNRIPFRPKWVWVYSFFYYPFIISIIFIVNDFRHFAYICTNFLILLIIQLLIAYIFPVKTPESWRKYNPSDSLSERFLSVVHKYDKGGNCFPSMHVGVATLTMLHLLTNTKEMSEVWRYLIILAPLLISVSTVFTKQHYLIDIPAGALLAFMVYLVHLNMYIQ